MAKKLEEVVANGLKETVETPQVAPKNIVVNDAELVLNEVSADVVTPGHTSRAFRA